MTFILGLDVSTSCTGICVLDSDAVISDGGHIKLLDYLNFKGCNTLFEKADSIRDYFSKLQFKPGILSLEEPLLGFSKGMSSAGTITTLMRFNGIVSYLARDSFKIEPTYISAARARKMCGVKLQKTSIAGMSHKEQVFKHMMEHDLSHVVWGKKKSGNPIDASRDMTDAYVIAKAASLLNK